jgi:hypothetical protein
MLPDELLILINRVRSHCVGIWDDHDYGIDDGNHQFHLKDVNRHLFLRFLNESSDSERWNRADGVCLFVSVSVLLDVVFIVRFTALGTTIKTN